MRPSCSAFTKLVSIAPPFYVSPSSVKSFAVPGFNHFSIPCRKLVFQYNQVAVSHEGLREYLRTSVIKLAKDNPHTEIVVRSAESMRTPTVSAFYTNGRWKSVSLALRRPDTVARRVAKFLDASGEKIVHLKRTPIVPGPLSESARGMWSGLHLPQPVNL
ncbi:hypothetical protein BDY24DRAFT_345679 [Mrakia frigida]|uniref:mitochondrial 54S ribosomal protein mL43 MRPL51 n=1 Tax=Mrakia frigida TaxID=29902 RepID=UPI003FCC05A4